MIEKVYKFNGIEYATLNAVRKAKYAKDRVIFGQPSTQKEFYDLGIELIERAISDPEPEVLTEEQLAKQKLEEAKSVRNEELNKQTVIVDNMVFDADADSIRSLHEVRDALEEGESSLFVLATDEVVTLTKDQIDRAYRAAVAARTALWVKPYAE